MKPRRTLGPAFAGCLSLVGCGGATNDPAPASLELHVSAAMPELIGGPIHFTINGSHFNRYGALDVTAGPMMSTSFTDIPSGQGYSLTLASDDGRSSCAGGGQFDIVDGQKTILEVALSCRMDPAKPVVITGGANECPEISSVTGSRSGKLGEVITLNAVADDGDHGPQPLSYTWLADSGVVGSMHSSTTTFICNKTGLATVVLTVSDGDLPCDQFFGVKIECGSKCPRPDDAGLEPCDASAAPP
jgi:hypothetical protein